MPISSEINPYGLIEEAINAIEELQKRCEADEKNLDYFCEQLALARARVEEVILDMEKKGSYNDDKS